MISMSEPTNEKLILEILIELSQESKQAGEERKKIQQDIEKIKDDVNSLKTSQAVLVNDNGWIKILYGIFSSIIIVFLGVLINLIFRLIG